jgi:glycosyltransferase involved in cell wall biosynthesis
MTQFHRIRILYVNHTGRVSGAERQLLTMLQVLDRSRYEPHVLCPEGGALPEMVKALMVPWIRTPQLNARFTWRPDRLLQYAASLWRSIRATRTAIRKLEPDVVHANSLRAGLVATMATIGTKRTVLWHVHDILPKHPVSHAIRLLAYLSERTRIVAVSHSAARSFCGGLPFRNRVQTIHNGVDLACFPLKTRGSSSFRNHAGIPNDAFLVCAVGQICARKGLLELVDAFASIYARAPKVHLAIVGKVVFAHEAQYRDLLYRRVAAAGIADRVHFTGERGDVANILQASDLLVLNSHEEPFGLVLVEAMSSGTPVLATRVGGVPEIIRDQENGWLVEKRDTAGLASKLLELSQNKEMLCQAAQFAREVTCPQFSVERFQYNLHRVYAELDSRPASTWRPHPLTETVRYGTNQGD